MFPQMLSVRFVHVFDSFEASGSEYPTLGLFLHFQFSVEIQTAKVGCFIRLVFSPSFKRREVSFKF